MEIQQDEENTPSVEQLTEVLETNSAERLDEFLRSLSSSEKAHILTELPAERQLEVLNTLESEDAAHLVESISEAQAVEIISNLEISDAAELFNELESNEQTDLLARLDPEHAEEILSEMDFEEASDARERLEYPAHSAGGLMITELLSYPETLTVEEVVRDLRTRIDDFSDHAVQYVFIASHNEHLLGVLRLRDLVLKPLATPVRNIMISDPLSVSVDTTLSELEDIFDGNKFLGVPVVDQSQRLVGVVRRADMEEALGERSDSAYLKASGILGGEELRSMPVLQRSRRRLSWLSVNILLNVMAASVIALHQETLEAVIALAVFLPIISDMSGCSGAQAIAVSIRELTLGTVRVDELLRVWSKEAMVGVINGVVLGCIIGLVAWAWKGNIYLGMVLGVALAVNTLIAVSVGGLLPLILKRLDRDPALASGPILTTMTDMCGFFIVLTLANSFLSLLV